MKRETLSARLGRWVFVCLCLTLAACGTTRGKIAHYGADPGPPEEVSAAAVAEEVSKAQANPSVELDSFETIIKVLPRARTQRAANRIVADALFGIRSLPSEQQQAALRRLQEALPTGLGGPGTIANPIPQSTDCLVAFDDPDVLAGLPEEAANTFAVQPWWVQECAANRHARVEPTVYSHYHLTHEDPTIGTCLIEGRFGRLTEDGNCEAVDHAAEPRTLASHFGNEIIRIRVTDSSNSQNRIFDMVSFTNLGPAVKVRCQKSDGQWLQWNSLAGDLAWDVSAYCNAIVQIQVTNSGTSFACGPDWETALPGGCPIGTASFKLDNFVLRP